MSKLQKLAIVIMAVPLSIGLYFLFWVAAQPIGTGESNPVFYWPVFWTTFFMLMFSLGGAVFINELNKKENK